MVDGLSGNVPDGAVLESCTGEQYVKGAVPVGTRFGDRLYKLISLPARDVEPALELTDLRDVEDEALAKDVQRVLRRAGLRSHERALVETSFADSASRDIWRVARALLLDSVREDRRWARRVARLERRCEFAVSALRGDDDVE